MSRNSLRNPMTSQEGPVIAINCIQALVRLVLKTHCVAYSTHGFTNQSIMYSLRKMLTSKEVLEMTIETYPYPTLVNFI